jgi:O-antigen/teichoic acid export membrane protein
VSRVEASAATAPIPAVERGVSTASAPALSLGSTVSRGAAWMMVGYGGSQALRFGSNLILTRLLLREDFGVMAIVNALLIGLQLFSDVGIGPSIIQSSRGDDPKFLNTAWTMQILRGFMLWLCACALAIPVASFYEYPQLAWIIPVAGGTALIAGFNSTRLFTAYRHLDLGRISMLELGAQAAGILVMIVWAYRDPSIWSLVAGGLVSSLAKLALSHTLLQGCANRLHWEKAALGSLLRFGRWIFFSTLLTFMVGQSDRLIFGKMVPFAMLGVYSMGALLAAMPAVALGRLASGVLFPLYSRVLNAGQDLRAMFGRVRRPILVLAGWMFALLAGGGVAMVDVLYPDDFAQAGVFLQILALGSWFAVLESTNGAALLARGEAHWTAAGNAAKLVGMVVLIPLGHYLGGFPGAVVGLSLSEIPRYAVSAWAAARAGLKGWALDLGSTAWLLATAALGWFVADFAQRRSGSLAVALGVLFIAVTLAWVPLAAPLISARRAAGRAHP